MLIKALCDYDDKLLEGGTSDAVPEGWGEQDIHFRIMLTEEGDIADIVDVRREEVQKLKGGKEKTRLVPRRIVVPFRGKSTSISCYCAEHRPFYIFGLSYEKDGFSARSENDKAKKSHDAFVKYNLSFFEGMDTGICGAVRRFAEKWNPESQTENPMLLKIGKEYKGAYFGFGLTGAQGNLEEDEQFRERFEQLHGEQKNGDEENKAACAVCGILGQYLPVARIHENVKLPGGNTTGCVLVGMKESAYTSYGKTQSYNSNVSEEAMKKYTRTLNRLLSSKNHRTIIGDMVIVYFAMKADDEEECDLFSAFFGNSAENADAALDKLFGYAASGGTTGGIDRNATFYVAGLTPNSSRICQKFMCRDSYGRIIDNLVQHQKDLMVEPESRHQVFFSRIAKELISPKSSNEKVPPPLMTNTMLAAFGGSNYPHALLETVVRRVKTDSDDEKSRYIKLNDTRAGIIKACINRKARLKGQKEEFTMSLNENNKSPAYLCGRLFAVLEKIQSDSSGGNLNRTIKDSYFSSACSRPASIMPKLMMLSQNHMRKLGEGTVIYYTKLIGEITDGFDGEYPQTLDLDSQGRFIIGYYQQNKALYTTKNKD
ncbi:MAG: type I-C CRISPR-associated protein Cas8c/Csd1 [Ruminococcaceae bacterium]|nr:type I-C CRISPR-associated protein Cas8c/Csd1 [Oscillospiraceae bacterium]